MSTYVPVSDHDPIRIIQSDYAFVREGIRNQHVSDARSMVWYEGGFVRMRLKVLNPRYLDYGDLFSFTVTVKVFRASESMSHPVSEETFSDFIDEPYVNVVEQWLDLKACDRPGAYMIKVYADEDCILKENIHLVNLPDPYVSAVKFSTLFLHKVNKGRDLDYENLGPHST